MFNAEIKTASVILGLNRHIVGLRFIDFKKEFIDLNVPAAPHSGNFCLHIRNSMDGRHYKCKAEEVACDYARYALGLSRCNSQIREGRSYYYCGLYESRVVAKDIMRAMQYIEHDIYGIEVGPLQDMDTADIVIIADYAETIMHIMQGYAYKYGSPKNLCFYGNQAMCSDLVAKPYASNDINVSLMCNGTRRCGRFDKGEIAVAFPINMFCNIVDGVVKTANAIYSLCEKQRITSKLEHDGNCQLILDPNYVYGLGLKKYDRYIDDILAQDPDNEL